MEFNQDGKLAEIQTRAKLVWIRQNKSQRNVEIKREKEQNSKLNAALDCPLHYNLSKN